MLDAAMENTERPGDDNDDSDEDEGNCRRILTYF